MASTAVILMRHVDLAEIKYGTPRMLDNGAKTIPIYHKDKPLVVQTEELRIPFGIRDGIKDENKPSSDKKTIEFAVDRETAPAFYDKISAFDALIIDDGMRNSKAWFRKAHDKRDVLEALYSHQLKHYRDKETGELSDRFPPLFKSNIPIKDGRIVTEVFDAERQKLDILTTDLRKARGSAIIQCTGVWIAGGKFGCSWKLLQLRVSSLATERITGYAFKDNDSDEEDSCVVTRATDEKSPCDDDDDNNKKASAQAAAFM